ncbi:related to CUE3 Meiotic induced gene, protein has a CUE domain that binds ubiquitin [Cephalotrichum gorgonifer]|uniref:Related to CUE3 Meiotic induced gene, protein has a CUE domain that binds ubiquitin n=1 Tax=Cephalotrichum gorgonifer TaxID=2041049 RepID=A0AAE8MTE7_9PEZI|nr:related to CUE3 Meiotic induced gene, protein has a CUE domain that binds ubiquitin [Cephalotrichum gorgonifer]
MPLPTFAPFPIRAWRESLPSEDWTAGLVAWSTLAQAYLALSPAELQSQISEDSSAVDFLLTFAEEVARDGPAILGSAPASRSLLASALQLSASILEIPSSPLLKWTFLADLSRVYGKKLAAPVMATVAGKKGFESELLNVKRSLTRRLEEGVHGDVRSIDADLARLNHLIHVSPDVAATFLAGSDFFDALVSAYRLMNPPLRKVIVATTYLCLVGLTDGGAPRFAMLSDKLFELKAAADAHRAGPLRETDSLVVDLVSSTPVLKQTMNKAEGAGVATGTLKGRITALEAYRRAGSSGGRSRKMLRKRPEKGKSVVVASGGGAGVAGPTEMNVHVMSQITGIQDLFPDLGAGFIARCLDEYGEDTEAVVAHLLEGSLPPHLAEADRSEELSEYPPNRTMDMAPRPTPPLAASPLPERRNIHDDDELDRLAVSTSALRFGKRPQKTADELLSDKASAPKKSAIYSALLAFDEDDDERDDTYDADDVGGAVDAADEVDRESVEEALYRAYQDNAAVFRRGFAGPEREKLKVETGMADEAVEGWAVMLERSAHLRQRLENKYTSFSGAQVQLASSRWKEPAAGEEGGEGADRAGGHASDRGKGGRMRGGRGGGRGRGGGAAGGAGSAAGGESTEATEAARRRKEAAKGSRANHNRRDQRAKKMARGGGLPG